MTNWEKVCFFPSRKFSGSTLLGNARECSDARMSGWHMLMIFADTSRRVIISTTSMFFIEFSVALDLVDYVQMSSHVKSPCAKTRNVIIGR